MVFPWLCVGIVLGLALVRFGLGSVWSWFGLALVRFGLGVASVRCGFGFWLWFGCGLGSVVASVSLSIWFGLALALRWT